MLFILLSNLICEKISTDIIITKPPNKERVGMEKDDFKFIRFAKQVKDLFARSL